MDKMLVAAFDTEEDAYKGSEAIKDLDNKGEITLYAIAVVTKDQSGNAEVKKSVDVGPVGTAVGMATGALVGVAGGPAGVAAVAAGGGLLGMLTDAGISGVGLDFLDEVSEVMVPGTSVIVAEVDEEWVTPLDIRIGELGGVVFRRPRADVVEDQLDAESAALSYEAQQIREEISQDHAESKTAAQATLKKVQARLKAVADKADAKAMQISEEAKAKTGKLQEQIKRAHAERKAKLEQRIAEIKADQKERSEKLQHARQLAREALAA